MSLVTRPSLFRFAALLAFLAMLLPVVAAANSCTDCLWGADSPECCPHSCCSCCVQLSPAPTLFLGTVPAHAGADLVEGAQDPHVAPDPRDVLHVPKIPLA